MSNAAEKLPEFDNAYQVRAEKVKRLFAVRRQIVELTNLHLRDLKQEESALEEELLATMEEGERIAFAGIGTVSCSVETVPSVDNWDELYRFIAENNAFYLLARKVNSAPFREAQNAGIDIPGLSAVKLRKLNCRAATAKK